MSDTVTIGRGVLQIEVDSTGAQAGIDTTSRSIEAQIKRIQQQASSLGKTTAEIKLQELAQRGATQAQLDAYSAAQKTIDAYRQQQTEARKAAEEATRAARAQAAAAALASGQLNSIQLAETAHSIRASIEMIATGQNPFRALALEGFRFTSIMGGIKQAFQALSAVFTAGRIIAGGFLAVLGGIGYAFYEGAKQSREFNEAIIKTGNYAGQTADSFTEMTRAAAEATHTAVGNVRELGMALIESGEIPQQVFAKATEAAANYARLTGKTAEDVAKDFTAMAEDPTKFAVQMSKQMNLVTSAQYVLIKGFQDHKDKASALAIIYDAIGDRAEKLRGAQGSLGRTLEEVKNQWSKFWDSVYDIGRSDKTEDPVVKRLKEIDATLKSPDYFHNAHFGADPSLQAERAGLAAQAEAAKKAAEDAVQRQADIVQLNKHAIEGRQFVDELAKRGKSIDLYNLKLAELKKAIKDNQEAGTPFSADKIKAAMDGLYQEYGNKREVRNARARADELAAEIKAGFEKQIKDQQGALAILETQRGAGLVDEQDYYDRKAALVEKDKDLTVSSLEGQRAEFQKISGQLRGKELSENAKRIVEINAQISDARKKAATEETQLAIQRVQAVRSVIAAYQAELSAAETALKIQNRNQARDVRAVGLGDAERNRLSQRNAIRDGFDAQRDQAEQAKAQLLILGKYTDTQKQMYEDRLSVINEFQKKALDSFDQYQQKLKAAQGDALNGAARAVQNYMSQAADIADQTANLVSNVFSGLEDTLAETLTKGGANWKGFLTSIATDINKMAIKSGLSKLFDLAKGGSFGDSVAGFANTLAGASKGKTDLSFVAESAAIDANTLALTTNNASLVAFDLAVTTATESLAVMAANNAGQSGGDALGAFIDAMGSGHAVGGPVSAGKLYPVNEKGPELLNVAGKQYLMMGANDGSVTPNGAYGKASNSTTIVVNVTPPHGASRETASQFGAAAARQMQMAMRRNG